MVNISKACNHRLTSYLATARKYIAELRKAAQLWRCWHSSSLASHSHSKLSSISGDITEQAGFENKMSRFIFFILIFFKLSCTSDRPELFFYLFLFPRSINHLRTNKNYVSILRSLNRLHKNLGLIILHLSSQSSVWNRKAEGADNPCVVSFRGSKRMCSCSGENQTNYRCSCVTFCLCENTFVLSVACPL